MRFLPKSAYLSAPQHASAYVSTATQLLSRAHSLYRASPQHRTSSSTDQSASAKAGNPLEALWPLAEGTFAAQLLVQLPKEDLVAGCLLYWRLLAVLPDLAPACDSTPVSEEARFVNALVSVTQSALQTPSSLLARPVALDIWTYARLCIGYNKHDWSIAFYIMLAVRHDAGCQHTMSCGKCSKAHATLRLHSAKTGTGHQVAAAAVGAPGGQHGAAPGGA